MGFGEKLCPTAAIASILSAYPFSVGLLRELLQNSDDAKASKQIFLLDYRTHPTDSLHHHELADTQGPALLACNDALFSEMDWEAVQTIYESSKTTDTSKIGKYGVGFRSCYHVTDNPQILSGSKLAVFDPHHAFTSSGGATLDWFENPNEHADQLSGFDFFISQTAVEPFQKTVIRLPLRTTAGAVKSLIKKDVVEPSKIRRLFDDFIEEEISIVLLFLTHISSIEIYEVNDQGSTMLAKAELVRSEPDANGTPSANTSTNRYSVKVTGCKARTWTVFHASYSDSEAVNLISNRLGYDVTLNLQKQKLLPKVGIAMPPASSAHGGCLGETNAGRLYTYLPLPLSTGFPCHIHGLFALTPDRQHLRNGEETGVVEGTDRVLVEWNRVMFDTFIPSAWAALLPVLLTQDKFTNIFEAWPPSRSSVQGGDTVYWNNLPRNVASAVARDKLAVWPVITPSSSGLVNPIFLDLSSVIVASDMDNQETLAALALAGASITQPPSHIRDLLSEARAHFDLLTPETARQALLKNVSRLSSLQSDPAKVDCVLSYLLSARDLAHIVDLPLVRIVNGGYVALKGSSDSGPAHIHILLTKSDMTIFSDCDQNAIDLTQLPSNVAELLLEKGPTTLNVDSLTCGKVIGYLLEAFHRFDINIELSSGITVPDAVIDWLALFWEWVGKWPHGSKLFPSINTLCLVPTSRNTLVPSAHGVFGHVNGLDMALSEALETAGISFLHPKVISAARLFLDEQLVVKSVMNGHHILDHISKDHAYNVKTSAATAFRNHLLSSLANSRMLGPLDVQQQRNLRCLPIYPVLVPPVSGTSGSCAVPEIKPIPDGPTIMAIVGIPLVPVIENTVFLDGCGALLSYLQGSGESLNTDGVLSMVVDHMAQQPKHLQRAFIEYTVNNRDNVTNGLLQRLSRAPFVAVCGDSTFPRAPQHLFDPDCVVASLFSNDSRCPSLSDDDDKAIVAGLQSLQLLRTTLADDVVEERIAYISQHPSAQENIDLALHLIQQLVVVNYDCSGLDIDPDSKWLPTRDGLLGSRDCHHHDAHPSELFDEVLAVLAVDHVSTSLVKALRWNEPISLGVVKGQLEKVLQRGHGHKKLHLIIQELSKRVDPLSQNKDDFLALISDHPWIPISPRCIASTSHAILSSGIDLPPGFYTIPFSLTVDHRIRQFLQLMGCSERPSSNALVRELNILRQRGSGFNTVKISLRILETLVDSDTDMSDEEQAQLLVPDLSGNLRPIASVFYNDLPPSACFVSLPDNVSVGHPNLGFELAKRLKMTFIGHSELKSLLITHRDMGEALTSRIKSVLVQYSVEQAFTEFLANAADAKATTFGIILDDKRAVSSRVLSPAFLAIQSCPSLVIYNNAVFEDKDFDGILNVGVGGKLNKSDTIGQFGLGALSMYHFTEVAMIVSGDKVMFLDPSRSYLPFPGRTSAIVTLSDIRRLYSDHLAPLCGLYDFSLNLDYYPGTLFRLPLRTGESLLSPHSYSMHDLRRLVEGHYLSIAPQALLFTHVDTIKAEHRDAHGRRSQFWTIQGDRQIYRDGTCESQALYISTSQGRTENGEWHVVLVESDLPSQFESLVIKHRLRNSVQVGLAADLTSRNSQHNFFATMPLPVPTQLPVQLSAPFILAPDRRSIRLDGDEAEYNMWLLSHLAPPLYIRLLETLLDRRDQKDLLWWKLWPEQTEDPLPRALVSSLYSCIADTDRSICLNVAGNTICPREAVFAVDEKSAKDRLLLHLKPYDLVRIPSYIGNALDGKIKKVNPEYVRQVIIQNANHVKDAFISGHLPIRDIEDIIHFLTKDSESGDIIVGLPLLPLADGSLATFGWSKDTTCYYTWSSPKHQPLFPLNRLVDSRFRHMRLDEDLNVSRLNGSAVRDLLEGRVPTATQRDNMTTEERSVIQTFWSEFEGMNLDADYYNSIRHLTLVPTATSGSYISLEKASTNTAIVMSASQLVPILIRLGAIIVRRDLCPESLRKVLDEGHFPHFSTNTVLSFFKTIKSTLANLFSRLTAPEHQLFAQWGRQNISEISQDSLPVARSLPFWPALEGTNHGPFLAASNVIMLPASVSGHSADVLPFLHERSQFAEYSPDLHHIFDVKPLSFTEFRDHLNAPRILHLHEMQHYKNLLRIIIDNRYCDSRDVLVPNSNRVLEYSVNLYARSQPLFLETFQASRKYQERLVHPDFQELEDGLGHFGLRNTMNFESFQSCIKVIHEDVAGPRRVERATPLYRWYCVILPILLASHGSFSWRVLDSFRFIPPSNRTRQVSYDQTQYACLRNMELFAPTEVLRSEHEAIAWTQRVPFTPSDSLRIADMALGVPTAVEVLEHLRVLTLDIAPGYPSNHDLLSDIKETYQWLEDHKEDSELVNSLVQSHGDPLFLNVDDPETMAWTWHSADQLYINLTDSPESDCWGVREFLRPFHGLLRIAGVEQVQLPVAPEMPTSSAEVQLNLMRNTFDGMRREGQLIDVIFITENDEEFPAHRLVLAGTSEYFRDMFLGPWGESKATNDRLEIPVPGCPADCLREILEHLYTGAIPVIEEQDMLRHVLHLAHRWEISTLVEAMQIQLVNHHISLDTYDILREEAQLLDVQILLEGCDKFEGDNQLAIRRFKGN